MIAFPTLTSERAVITVESIEAPADDLATEAAPPPLPSAWAKQYEYHHENLIIGRGSYATVLQLRHVRDQGCFACKVIQRSFLDVCGMGAQLAVEIHAMQLLDSSCHVVRMLDMAEESGYVFLLLELCQMGDLYRELITQPECRISDDRARICTKHILQGLLDLHNLGIMHRDIKLENLLVTMDGSVKLADFGWAAYADQQRSDMAGSFQTMAPEVLREEAQTTAVDIWSAGAVLYNLVTGLPLLDIDLSEGLSCKPLLLAEIQRRCPLQPSARPPHVSEPCWDLLCQMLLPAASQRPAAAEALQHHWFSLDPESTQSHTLQVGAFFGKVSHTPPTASPPSSTRSGDSDSWYQGFSAL